MCVVVPEKNSMVERDEGGRTTVRTSLTPHLRGPDSADPSPEWLGERRTPSSSRTSSPRHGFRIPRGWAPWRSWPRRGWHWTSRGRGCSLPLQRRHYGSVGVSPADGETGAETTNRCGVEYPCPAVFAEVALRILMSWLPYQDRDIIDLPLECLSGGHQPSVHGVLVHSRLHVGELSLLDTHAGPGRVIRERRTYA